MLISFSVENFLSFNTKTEFSFKSGHIIKKPEHVYSFKEGQVKLLKFAAIYGKNGAGKTNLLKALNFVKKIITSPNALQKAKELWCRCNEQNEKLPSTFEICFLADNSIFDYLLKVNLSDCTILEEKLINISGKNEQIVFKSVKDSGYEFNSDIDSKELQILSSNFDSTRLSLIYYINTNANLIFTHNKNSLILKKVYEWFYDTLEIIYSDQNVRETALSSVDRHFYLDEFSKLLNDFDSGITKIDVVSATKDEIFNSLPSSQQKQIDVYIFKAIENFKKKQQKQKSSFNNNFSIVLRSRNDICIIYLDNDGEPVYNRLLFIHEYNGQSMAFRMAEESEGIYRLFQLIEILLTRNEKVYIIDEINRSLHPKLCVQFVRKYLEYAKDKKLELLTTTHETNLMNLELLRQDEIWIADLKPDNSTSLCNLGELKVRTDVVINKNYLSNSWGGVPVFKEDFNLMDFLTGNM